MERPGLKWLVATVLLACACTTKVVKTPAENAEPDETTAPQDEPDAAPSLNDNGTLSVPQDVPERIVAIGNLHGDLDATRRVLRLAGAIDESDEWVGGELVVVQTGDTIDRGDDDRAIIDLLEHLKTEAPKTGGRVVAMVGNHEVMNAMLDFRYVNEGAFGSFADVKPANDAIEKEALKLDAEQQGRAAAFLPGGPYAKILSTRPAIARVGDTIFLHGGILPKYVKDLDATNEGLHDFLVGERAEIPDTLTESDGPVWLRDFSDGTPDGKTCAALEETLTMLNAKRMVMGHTVQNKSINSVCDGKAWRIDIGMSSYYSGPIQALELRGDVLNVLKE